MPVTLSSPSATPVTVDWTTLDIGSPGIAARGSNYLAGSGTVTLDTSFFGLGLFIIIDDDSPWPPRIHTVQKAHPQTSCYGRSQ